jgi:hypothetical protein
MAYFFYKKRKLSMFRIIESFLYGKIQLLGSVPGEVPPPEDLRRP